MIGKIAITFLSREGLPKAERALRISPLGSPVSSGQSPAGVRPLKRRKVCCNFAANAGGTAEDVYAFVPVWFGMGAFFIIYAI